MKQENAEKKVVLFIECGTTISSPINTGIQRVVRNIILHASSVSGDLGMQFSPVAFVNNTFREVSIEEVKPLIPSAAKVLLQPFEKVASTVVPGWIYYGLRERLKSWIKGMVRKEVGRDIYQIFHNHVGETKDESQLPILLLLDSTWDTRMWGAVEEFRAKGGWVCAVLYDLIPFTHPDTVAEATRAAHTQWWLKAPLHVDSVMCISRSVKDDFLAWQMEQKLERVVEEPRVGYFYLGAELKQTDPVIHILSAQTPTYLVVGSLEPRKNHALVLDAFERLWAEGFDGNLAIVGAFGWKSEDLLDRINRHPELGRKLFLIRDASDRDLTALYDKCQALIIASFAEGFGLPIVEAAQRGAPVICSDIPVFREVASDQLATFFNPFETQSLVDAIKEQAKQRKCETGHVNKANWISWRQSAEQLLGQMKEIVAQNK